MNIKEFQQKFPSKQEKHKALLKMSNEEIDQLIASSTNTYGKIFYSKYKKN